MSSNLYDGLPLDTPTVVVDDGDVQLVATRTKNGGTVEHRPRPGGPTDQRNQGLTNQAALLAKGTAAVAANLTYLGLASPTNVQVAAQVQSLTRQVTALLRVAAGLLDTTAGT